jgi:hypothetical protein
MGLCMWYTFSRIRDRTSPTPYICCNYTYCSTTAHTVVKLVGYSRELPEKYSDRTPGLVLDQDFHINVSP